MGKPSSLSLQLLAILLISFFFGRVSSVRVMRVFRLILQVILIIRGKRAKLGGIMAIKIIHALLNPFLYPRGAEIVTRGTVSIQLLLLNLIF